MSRTSRVRVHLIGLAALAVLAASCTQPPTGGGGPVDPPPPEPEEELLIPVTKADGLEAPTNVEFAPDGRVFLTEKAGRVLTFDDIDDPEPTVSADLRDDVRNVGEHGLLGLAIDPDYPAEPYVYVMHAWDITGRWGDGCNAYGLNGCVTGARIGRYEVDPGTGVQVGGPGTESIVEDRWCYQFSSHGQGDIEFLPDGTLLASSGEGANWNGADYGQFGGTQTFPPLDYLTPRNACDDPPNGAGGAVSPVTSEGGALRAQDLLTEGDPVTWDGSLVRIDPDTGEAPADNPLVGVGEVDDDAVVAHGLRNPYRYVIRPGTSEVYTIDVGFGRWEEINKVEPLEGVTPNFGWPCREGARDQATYGALNNNLCNLALSGNGRTPLTDPWFTYPHTGGAAISAISFISPGRYPAEYDDSLIFTDYVKGVTWSLGIEPDGSPSPDGPIPLMSDGILVDLEAAPDGYVYGVDYYAGTLVRLVDRADVPVARLVADPVFGPLPMTVQLDASTSSHSGEGALSFEWDLDGDGEFDDATGPTTSVELTEPENLTVSVRVTDAEGASSVASTTLYPGNTAPEVDIVVNSPLPWSTDDLLEFDVVATDAEDGALPAENVSWEADLHHCYTPEDCHAHPYVGENGSLGGTIEAPSHGFPSFLSLTATATDSRGATTTVTVDLHPASVTLEFTSDPPGAVVVIGDEERVTPFTYEAIRNDRIAVSVPSPQDIGGVSHVFSAWDHGGAASQDYVAAADGNVNVTLLPE